MSGPRRRDVELRPGVSAQEADDLAAALAAVPSALDGWNDLPGR